MINFQYMRRDCPLPAYYQFPEFLLNIDMTQTAKLVYMILYDRSRLSMQNNWIDEKGNVYIVFPIFDLAKAAKKGSTSIKTALHELEELGLLKRKFIGVSKPKHLYIKIPGPDSDPTVRKRAFQRAENRLPDGRNSGSSEDGKPTPNKVKEKSYRSKNTEIRKSTPDYSYEEGESL